MALDPLVSFIVLSYNYENYIRPTLESILGQTFQRFEVIVVDDASSDGSVAVVRSFADPRIQLHINDRNMGGAWSYNRAVTLARGDFLASVDADDWIEPAKTEHQLAAFEREPTLDIVGTYITVVDGEGKPHPRADEIEGSTNQPHDFNRVETWVVHNFLCHSSTLVRRSVHERIGLDEPSMVRAPDYELWTRALRNGCRFGLVAERLTNLRVHPRSVTHLDPPGAYLEICYLLLKNLLPLIEERNAHASMSRAIEWAIAHEQFVLLGAPEQSRLLAVLLGSPVVADFEAFKSLLASQRDDPELSIMGRRCLALVNASDVRAQIQKLRGDIDALVGARDFFRQQAQNWQQEAEGTKGLIAALEEARDFHAAQARNWQREYESCREQLPSKKRK